MDIFLKLVSFAGLCLTILPAIFVFNDVISFKMHTHLMVVGMFLWFATSPFWMKEKKL